MSEAHHDQEFLEDWKAHESVFKAGVTSAIQDVVFGRLPRSGLNYVSQTMRAPSRNVESTVRSSSGKYASRKMGCTIGFESFTGEYLVVLKKERDPNCIAYLDQAQPIKVRAKSGNRTIAHYHRPDFLCVEAGRVVLVEFKRLEAIQKKNALNPEFFVFEGGRWTCPSAAESAKQLGIEYEVWTDMDFTPVEIRNAKIVDAYLCGSTQKYDKQVELLRAYMNRPDGRTIATMLDDLAPELTIDGIYAAIAREAVAFDLRSVPLVTHSACELFQDASRMEAFQLARAKPLINTGRVEAGDVQIRVGTQVMWNAVRWRCLSLAHNQLILAPNADVQPVPLGATQPMPISSFLLMVRSGEMTIVNPIEDSAIGDRVASMLQAATSEHLQTANDRYALIVPYLKPGAPPCVARSHRRYLKSYRTALHELGNGYVGLLPRWSESGNRKARISTAVIARVQHFVNERYLTPDQPSALSVYRNITDDLNERGLPLPSYEWFCKLVGALPAYEVALARKGRKGAYIYEPRVTCVDRNAVPVSERAFELGHVDHTEIDFVVRTEGDPARLWLTVMICEATRRVLSFVLSFEKPSYRQVMLAIRDCVRRHGRLPEMIMVDGGKEFSSIYFETLCATFHVVIRRRPKSKARFGAQIERLFGTTNTRLFYTMVANTQNTRNPRQLTEEIDPYRRAIWAVGGLKTAIEKFYFEAYDTQTHSSLMLSPRQAAARSFANYGTSPHRLIAYDETFQILSSPAGTRETATVQPDGVKINYLYYNHPELRAHLGKKLEVRFDPFNLANAWAHDGGTWLKLTSRHASVLVNHSQHDVQVVTEAWRDRRKNVQRQTLSEPGLIRLLRELGIQEELLKERLQSQHERILRSSDERDDDVIEDCVVSEASSLPPDPPLDKPQRIKLVGALRELEEL